MASPLPPHKLSTDSKRAYRAVLTLALPTVLAMLSQSIVNEVDIIFFAYLPQPDASNAQAALMPSLVLLWLFGGSLSAISVGTQALAARRIAESDVHAAGTVLVNSWVFSAIAGVLFTATSYLSLPFILSAMIQVPAVREAAESYLQWRLLGIASMALTFSFKSFFDGVGRTVVHMAASVVMNVINVLLCWLLIFGKWGAPEMGIAGAGLAGFVSTWVGLFIMVWWAAKPAYRQYSPFRWRNFSRPVITAILRLSIPSAVATIAVMSGFLLFAGIVSHLDALVADGDPNAEPVNSAATSVIVGLLKLTFTACLAFGTSTATLVSQSLGEGKPEQASRFGWVSVRLGLFIFGAVGLIEGVFFTEELLGIITKSEAVIAAATVPMRIMGVCTPLIAVGMILTQALFGAGNTRFVMITELLLHFACLVPLAWLLGVTLEYGLVGIWTSSMIYVTLLAAVMSWKFRQGDWSGIKI